MQAESQEGRYFKKSSREDFCVSAVRSCLALSWSSLGHRSQAASLRLAQPASQRFQELDVFDITIFLATSAGSLANNFKNV